MKPSALHINHLMPESIATSSGAVLGLRFTGSISVRRLFLGGKSASPGTYSAASSPSHVQCSGLMVVKE